MDKEVSNANGISAEGLAQIAPAMKGVVDAGDLSGIVTLIWRKGEIAHLNCTGYRNIEEKLPMTRDTLFRIASMSKPVTSVAVLMLMEEGKLKLSDPIAKWAPEFAEMRVLKDPNGPVAQTYPAPRQITIEDLMTHRSGLAYGFTSVGPIAQEYQKRLGDVLNMNMTADAWMAALASLPLTYPPGERFHYSHATDVLGFLVGRISGMPFRDFLMKRLFAPLGMADTDFFVPVAKRNRAATLYQLSEKTGSLQPVPFKHHDSAPDFCGGGGGLISTLDDYLSFARMLLNKGELNGTRYLRPETVAMMATNRLTDEQRAIAFMGIPFWLGQGFGLGLSVITDPEKQAWMGAGSKGAFGWPGAFGTWWQADPAEDMVMMYLIQNYTPLTPDMAGQAVTGARMGGRVAGPMFQKITYAALGK